MAQPPEKMHSNRPANDAGRRRKVKRRTLLAAVLLITVLVISFVPTYVARSLLVSQLDAWGIQHAGVASVRVNLWKREAWAGPLEFYAAGSEAGQLAELGIKVNLLPFFKKHASVEKVLVRGIDLVVVRTDDNTVTLNGIPLQQLFPTEQPGKDEPEADKPWGMGIGDLELRDSRLIFNEKTGGVLTIEIERLVLDDFKSWHPHVAGTFSLAARINDIDLNWTGTARPFSENIAVSVETRTENADLVKISRFTGP